MIELMKIYLASDHGGFLLKEKIKSSLEQQLVDLGAHEINPSDDYPLFAFKLAEQVMASTESAIGLLFCRSGSGMAIAANKVKGVKAVEVYSPSIARHAIEHNHANVFTFGADFIDEKTVLACLLEIFKNQPSQEERHLRRLKQISNYENQH